MFCAFCGKQIDKDIKICPFCHQEVDQDFMMEQTSVKSEKNEPTDTLGEQVSEEAESERDESKEITGEQVSVDMDPEEKAVVSELSEESGEVAADTEAVLEEFGEVAADTESVLEESDQDEVGTESVQEAASEVETGEAETVGESDQTDSVEIETEEKAESEVTEPESKADVSEEMDETDSVETESAEEIPTGESAQEKSVSEKSDSEETDSEGPRPIKLPPEEQHTSPVPRQPDPEKEEKRQARKKKRRIKKALSLTVLFVGIVLLIGVVYMLVNTLLLNPGESNTKVASVQTESLTTAAPTVSVTPTVTAQATEVTLNEEDFQYSSVTEYQTGSFQFTLPDYWDKLTDCQIGDDNSITFYQKKSTEAGADGEIFSVKEIFSEDLASYAPCRLLRREGDISYVLATPADQRYATTDPYIAVEYARLENDASYVFQSFSLIGEEILVTPTPTPEPEEPADENAEVPESSTEGFILPESASRYLTVDDLAGLTSDQLWVARNEIYAREGRLFDDPDLQAYFDGQGWYNGTISPDDFSDDMLTDIEKRNAELIRSLE